MNKNNSMISKEKIQQRLKDNPFFFTRGIIIEMSNICNYSNCHVQCPLYHFEDKKKVLELKYIKKVVDELSQYNFKGMLYPFDYSEPLIDPRLYYVLSYFKEKLPECFINIITNGYYLNRVIMDELIEFGVNRIAVSFYSKEEENRLRPLVEEYHNKNLPNVFFRGMRRYPMQDMMRDRVDIYTRDDYDQSKLKKKICREPYSFVQVNASGDVCLCCYDYKATVTFGNIKEDTLYNIINSEKMVDMFYNLIQGNREYCEVCKKCNSYR